MQCGRYKYASEKPKPESCFQKTTVFPRAACERRTASYFVCNCTKYARRWYKTWLEPNGGLLGMVGVPKRQERYVIDGNI